MITAKMLGVVWSVCLACMLLRVDEAVATDRFFPDIHKRSPGEQYKLDAVSPDNNTPDGRRAPFATNFTYTLTEVKTSQPKWALKQGADQASPVSAWVHDTGWVVVRTGWDDLFAVDPATGKVTGSLRILDQFPKSERDTHVHQTTAGPMWSESSRWYILEHSGALHFVVRAHWGTRVILHLASGKAVKDEGTLHDTVVKAEDDWVLHVLRTSVPKLLNLPFSVKPNDEYSVLVWDVQTAIDMAARDKKKASVPLLREAEKCE